MNIASTIQEVMDKIPAGVATLRDLITKVLTGLNLPAESALIVFAIIALVGAYFWIKQFVVGQLIFRASIILNMILLALLLYITLVYLK
jgi:hypothetical protein